MIYVILSPETRIGVSCPRFFRYANGNLTLLDSLRNTAGASSSVRDAGSHVAFLLPDFINFTSTRYLSPLSAFL